MSFIYNHLILTDVYEKTDEFNPESDSIYIFSRGVEYRSGHVEKLKIRNAPSKINFIEILGQNKDYFFSDKLSEKFFLKSSLDSFWSYVKSKSESKYLYIDMTGLDHPVWAVLLKSAVTRGFFVSFVYVEPDKYTKLEEGQYYDLSTSIDGIEPIATFGKLDFDQEKPFIFIPLLGFEGFRLSHAFEMTDPDYRNTFPIICAPGFKSYYVFESYKGNMEPLMSKDYVRNAIKYATGNCPFSAYFKIKDIASEKPSFAVKIAMIGTKPHALGAVMFALTHSSQSVELIYDHPKRKTGRTTGTERLLVYHVSSIVQSLPDSTPQRTRRARPSE